MSWNISVLVIYFTGFLLSFWAVLRRSNLGWSKSKTGAYILSVLCFAFLLLFLFDLTSCAVLPAEAQSRVSQLGLLNLPGTRCKFEVTSPDGSRVKLHSIVTEPFKVGDTVRVTYNPWRSEAYTVERLGVSNPQVLLDYRSQSGFYRIRPLVDAIVVLFTAIGCIFCVRKFTLELPQVK
jgi:hypothetical protein